MSNDASVTKDLMQTLEDGREGFANAAEKLTDADRLDLASRFRTLSAQRGEFHEELSRLAATHGDEVDSSGSIAGTAHRAWMSVKDALTGDDPAGLLTAVEKGEEHAVSEYEKALEKDISPKLQTVIEQQLIDIRAAHAAVRRLAQNS